MSRQYFGTDGVRGPVGGPLINPDFASRLGQAAARWLRRQGGGAPTGPILVGRDTRASGPALEAAVAAGFRAEGMDVLSLGVVPTPAVARAVRTRGGALGVVITASHNPASDNGIKFFGASGMKLSDEQELAIEQCLPEISPGPLSAELPCLDSAADYAAVAQALLPAGSLAGWRIVLDTANGATCGTSPQVLSALGAELVGLGDKPDGLNINAGVGSEHPELLATRVLETGARLGIAHDGDGDRCILCDEKGQVLDGDEILVMLAAHALRRGTLAANTLVVTVQSNLGVDRALQQLGGAVSRTNVGDRYVLERMLRLGANLGGESSGHIICSDISPTGDGLVAALRVLDLMLASGQPLSVLRGTLRKFPQLSKALKVRAKIPLEQLPRVTAALREVEAGLGSEGRLLVRYSGTEAKLRLLVEGPTLERVGQAMSVLESAVRQDLDVL